jgi:hypothetical protein
VSRAEEALADQLAVCIGALEAAADMLARSGAPNTSNAVRKIAHDALAALVAHGIEERRHAA